MKFAEFFKVIHQLSRKQKSNFSRFTSSQRNTLPNRLYHRILGQKEFSAESSRKIKGKEFSNDSVFRFNKNTLMSRLRESIANYEYGDNCFENQILAAVQLGDTDWASKSLLQRIYECYCEGRFSTAMYLWDFMQELSVFFRFEISKDEIKSFFASKDERNAQVFLRSLQNEFQSYRVLILALDELKNSIKCAKAEQSAAANKWRSIANFVYDNEVNSRLACMIRLRIQYIDGQISQALREGVILINEMLSSQDRFPAIMVEAELRLILLMAVKIKKRDLATQLFMKFSLLQINNPQHERLIRGNQIFIGATVSAVFADLSIAKDCYSIAKSNPKVQPENIATVTFYNLGIAFFYNEEYQIAIECMNEVRAILPNQYHALQWEPQLVLAICHFTLGNIDFGDSALRSASRYASRFETEYPTLAVRMITKRYKSTKRNQITAMDLKKVKNLLKNPEELHSSKDFHLQTWIRAQIESKSQKEIIDQLHIGANIDDDFNPSRSEAV